MKTAQETTPPGSLFNLELISTGTGGPTIKAGAAAAEVLADVYAILGAMGAALMINLVSSVPSKLVANTVREKDPQVHQ